MHLQTCHEDPLTNGDSSGLTFVYLIYKTMNCHITFEILAEIKPFRSGHYYFITCTAHS